MKVPPGYICSTVCVKVIANAIEGGFQICEFFTIGNCPRKIELKKTGCVSQVLSILEGSDGSRNFSVL